MKPVSSRPSSAVGLARARGGPRPAPLLLRWSAALAAALAATPSPADPEPVRRPMDADLPSVARIEELARWDFARGAAPWPAMNAAATTAVTGGALRIEAAALDPMVRLPVPPVRGPLVLSMRLRAWGQGPAEIYWSSRERPGLDATKNVRLPTCNDGRWHEVRAVLPAAETYDLLRFDPVVGTGLVDIAEARLERHEPHPLQFAGLRVEAGRLLAEVRNISGDVRAFDCAGRRYEAAPGQAVAVEQPLKRTTPFEAVCWELKADGLPPHLRWTHVHHPDVALDGPALEAGDLSVRAARDGSGLRLLWKGVVTAVACPLVQRPDGSAVPLALFREGPDGLVYAGGPVERLSIRLENGEAVFDLRSREEVMGPALRAVGSLEQGLLAGVEYLGRGETSSSTLDLERPERLRYEPDPLLVTMPLAAFVTDAGAVAMRWTDMTLRPVFSSPNHYDGTPDHLMALRGRAFEMRVRVGGSFASGGRIEDAILWAVRARGLPPPPPAPRGDEAQLDLYRRAFDGPLRSSNGWYHATWSGNPAHWFADHASTIWRLTGKVPETPHLVFGGAHVANSAVYFVTGRAREWLGHVRGQAEDALRRQRPDGSFGYDGPYRRGHFEDTASGHCALYAVRLLDGARYTGDRRFLEAGLKTLDYMARFRTPRGAQVWEIPLHTPDLYASAFLVQAYLRGHELTGRADFLERARRWALSGLPFVYQWDDRPVMRYATIAVLGATDWTGVVWIGLPVQWCGTCYAHALLDLAHHDSTLDWRRVAEGILVAAEQMLYPDGPDAGCLPDSFSLRDQRRNPANVNPCVMVSLRRRLAGQPDALYVAAGGGRRIAAPFPVVHRDGVFEIAAPEGLAYQVALDGDRILDVTSRGRDVVDPCTP